MYNTTVEFYNKSTETLSNSYNSIIDNLSEEKPVIQEPDKLANSKPVPSTEANLLTAKINTEDVIVMENRESIKNNTIIKDVKKLEVNNIETDKTPVIVKINIDVTEPVAAIEPIESNKLALKESDLSDSEITIIEKMEVTKNDSVKVASETAFATTMTEKSATSKITDVKNVTTSSEFYQPSPVTIKHTYYQVI